MYIVLTSAQSSHGECGRVGHVGLRYCGIELFFKRHFGNFDANMRYHVALRYAVFHPFRLGTSHNLSWRGGGGWRRNWGAFNFFWMEYGGP